ncbi:MAG: GntR family transcriptional regulator, partial [Nitrospinota bacterium]
QIADLLRRQIELGDLAPGMKLPKELELAEMFGVSRVPVRQALSMLVSDGLLKRSRGHGTFVTDDLKKPKALNLTGIAEEFVSHGMEGEFRLFSVQDVPPSPRLAELFGLGQRESLTRVQRVRMVENVPFCYVINYLPSGIGRKIPNADFEKLSLLKIFENRLRIPLGEIHQTIEARTADKEIASLLSLGIMAPVMYVDTYVYRKEGTPLEYSQIFYRGDRFKYSVSVKKHQDRAEG